MSDAPRGSSWRLELTTGSGELLAQQLGPRNEVWLFGRCLLQGEEGSRGVASKLWNVVHEPTQPLLESN